MYMQAMVRVKVGLKVNSKWELKLIYFIITI